MPAFFSNSNLLELAGKRPFDEENREAKVEVDDDALDRYQVISVSQLRLGSSDLDQTNRAIISATDDEAVALLAVDVRGAVEVGRCAAKEALVTDTSPDFLARSHQVPALCGREGSGVHSQG